MSPFLLSYFHVFLNWEYIFYRLLVERPTFYLTTFHCLSSTSFFLVCWFPTSWNLPRHLLCYLLERWSSDTDISIECPYNLLEQRGTDAAVGEIISSHQKVRYQALICKSAREKKMSAPLMPDTAPDYSERRVASVKEQRTMLFLSSICQKDQRLSFIRIQILKHG